MSNSPHDHDDSFSKKKANESPKQQRQDGILPDLSRIAPSSSSNPQRSMFASHK
jgi:hypothetical protein